MVVFLHRWTEGMRLIDHHFAIMLQAGAKNGELVAGGASVTLLVFGYFSLVFCLIAFLSIA